MRRRSASTPPPRRSKGADGGAPPTMTARGRQRCVTVIADWYNMAGMSHSTGSRLIPYVLVTDPPLARVGLSENEAQRRGIAFRIAKLPIDSVLRALTTDETQGFMKVLVGAEDDRIIGFTMIGAEADDVMTTVQTAMLADMPYHKLRDAIFVHPTMVEGLGSLLDRLPALSA